MRERTSGGTVLVEVRATFRRGAPAVVRDRDGEVRAVDVADVVPVQRGRERELCERCRGNSRPARPAVLDIQISSCRVQDRARTYLLHSSPPLHCCGTSGRQRYPRCRVHKQLTPPVSHEVGRVSPCLNLQPVRAPFGKHRHRQRTFPLSRRHKDATSEERPHRCDRSNRQLFRVSPSGTNQSAVGAEVAPREWD